MPSISSSTVLGSASASASATAELLAARARPDVAIRHRGSRRRSTVVSLAVAAAAAAAASAACVASALSASSGFAAFLAAAGARRPAAPRRSIAYSSFSSSPSAGRRPSTQSRAKGFAVDAEVVSAAKPFSTESFEQFLQEEGEWKKKSDIPASEKPKYELPGPLKPPAAPASYKALMKLRLRKGPSRFADVVPYVDVPKGETFYVDKAVLEEDEYAEEEGAGTLFLRAGDKYENGWIMETGVAGSFAGKRVVKRLAPTVGERRQAVYSVSQVYKPEVAEARVEKAKAAAKNASQAPREAAPVEEEEEEEDRVEIPPVVINALKDPQIRELCESAGIGADELRKNPEFLIALTKRLAAKGADDSDDASP